ncbi:hypothetical protein [Haloprofundus sp. MHR1]|uniref:hypothetical protein n=1 Tax=Haloprofundus sp. MHR1 TaxID=2572921 RepID=UPI0010BE8B5B|nr:hypothetical protein [Haloprofundus sp. MHR1]QCJ46400.1 hypothetical protein FCF25_04365 [Haloprofundus sp. MHR1]
MVKSRVCVIILLVLTAGCLDSVIDAPVDQEEPVEFVAENLVNDTTFFKVYVVDLPANLTLHLSDGRQGTFAIGEGVGPSSPGDNRTYTKVEVPESARLHGNFTLGANESVNSSIGDLPRGFAIVVTVHRDKNEIISYVTANCDDLPLIGLKVTRYPEGVSVVHSCT